MKLENTDIQHLNNLEIMLTDGEYKLSGQEALAFAQTYSWLKQFKHRVADGINAQVALERAEAQQLTKKKASSARRTLKNKKATDVGNKKAK